MQSVIRMWVFPDKWIFWIMEAYSFKDQDFIEDTLLTEDCCCSFTKLSLTLWDPKDCSMLGFSVLHYLPEFAQTHVNWVDDAIQPSHPGCPLLLLLSIFPSIRVFFNASVLLTRWPKYWSFSFSISPSSEFSGLISFRIDWFDLLAVQRTLKSLLQKHSMKASILQCSAFFTVQLNSVHDY